MSDVELAVAFDDSFDRGLGRFGFGDGVEPYSVGLATRGSNRLGHVLVRPPIALDVVDDDGRPLPRECSRNAGRDRSCAIRQ